MFTSESGRAAGMKSKRGSGKNVQIIREAFMDILENQEESISEALEELRRTDAYKYLIIIDKMAERILPKPMEAESKREIPTMPQVVFKYEGREAVDDAPEELRERILNGEAFTLSELNSHKYKDNE